MLPEMVMAKVEGTTQASLLSSLAGKSYTVGQVTATGNGLGTWLFLSPDGGAGAASQGAVALKLEGTRQMAQMSGLVGKSVTVGKAPTVVGGIGKWVVLYPNAGLAAKGAAAVGAAGLGAAGTADSQILMLKLSGKYAAQTPFLTGKTFTVIKTTSAAGAGTGKWLFLQPVGDAAAAAKDIVVLKVHHGAAQLPWLVGKTFTIGQAPMVAGGNAAKYLVLHPATGVLGKSAVGVVGAAKGMTAARVVEGAAAKGLAPTMKTVALQTVGTGTTATGTAAVAAGKTVAAATAANAAKGAAAGTIWTGKGLSLGLGLGLGAAGPLILGAVIIATGYGIYQYRKNYVAPAAAVDDDLKEALA
ncbi:MAG: hypothetical protein H7840_02470 [Alphaproteobacteria bacterium]